jgi:hypothetical protein
MMAMAFKRCQQFERVKKNFCIILQFAFCYDTYPGAEKGQQRKISSNNETKEKGGNEE